MVVAMASVCVVCVVLLTIVSLFFRVAWFYRYVPINSEHEN